MFWKNKPTEVIGTCVQSICKCYLDVSLFWGERTESGNKIINDHVLVDKSCALIGDVFMVYSFQ